MSAPFTFPAQASGTAGHPAHLPIADARTTVRQLRAALKPYRARLGLTVLLLVAGSAAALLVPALLGRIVDAVVDGRTLGQIGQLTTAVFGAGLLSAAILWWGERLLVSCLQHALAGLREEVFAVAVRLEQAVVEEAGSADAVTRVTGDVEAITEATSEVLPTFVRAAFLIGLTAVGLAAIDPWLAAAALLAVPVQGLSTRRFLRRSRPLYRQLRQQESHRGQAIIEAVTGAHTIIAHRAQPLPLQQVADRSLAAVATQRRAGRARNRFYAGLNGAEYLGLAAVLAVGFWRADTAGLSVGSVTAAALLFHRLFGPIGAVLTSLDDLQRAGAGLGRLVGVLQAGPPATPGAEISGRDVEVRGLSYVYAPGAGAALSSPALNSVSLRIPDGSTTVLVGQSGSGKSTLAQLIAGVLTPTVGAVTVGGAAANLARRQGRRAILLVTQDTHLFVGTVADNLRLADPHATDLQLDEALDQVGAHWVHDLPAGLDTPVTHDLDDARIQQLALARVLLADPAVVVLDEATAHGGGEGQLDGGVAAAVRGRTAVIVAHRFAQAEWADQIVVLERGRVAELGTHAALRARPDGIYSRLYRSARAGA